ncbi:MAG: hypothetical protein IPP40_18170 [bacterium]|nr:hypothetical protein [bacterium]
MFLPLSDAERCPFVVVHMIRRRNDPERLHRGDVVGQRGKNNGNIEVVVHRVDNRPKRSSRVFTVPLSPQCSVGEAE